MGLASGNVVIRELEGSGAAGVGEVLVVAGPNVGQIVAVGTHPSLGPAVGVRGDDLVPSGARWRSGDGRRCRRGRGGGRGSRIRIGHFLAVLRPGGLNDD